MPVEDVFSISGRGTVVTGRVERGIVKVGEEVEIVGIKPTVKTTCTGVEMFRKLLDQGQAGDNVGVLLRGTKREDVERGQVLAKPGSITPHTNFNAEVYVLTKEEGGRHTPFFNGYRPQFYFRTTDVTGSVELPDGTEMVMPGDNVSMTVNADRPDRHGRRSALRHPRRRSYRRRRRRREDHRVRSIVDWRWRARVCRAVPACAPSLRFRRVAQLAERRSPKPQVGGSIPSWPATIDDHRIRRQRSWPTKSSSRLPCCWLSAGVAGFYLISRAADDLARARRCLAGVVLRGVAVAWFTETGRSVSSHFAHEAVVEAKKVVWPTRKETMQTTGIVFAFVVVMALFLWLTDKSLEWVLYDPGAGLEEIMSKALVRRPCLFRVREKRAARALGAHQSRRTCRTSSARFWCRWKKSSK